MRPSRRALRTACRHASRAWSPARNTSPAQHPTARSLRIRSPSSLVRSLHTHTVRTCRQSHAPRAEDSQATSGGQDACAFSCPALLAAHRVSPPPRLPGCWSRARTPTTPTADWSASRCPVRTWRSAVGAASLPATVLAAQKVAAARTSHPAAALLCPIAATSHSGAALWHPAAASDVR